MGLLNPTMIMLIPHQSNGRLPLIACAPCSVQRATRYGSDLGLNWQGIALVLDLLEQRDRLNLENAALLKRLQRVESQDS